MWADAHAARRCLRYAQTCFAAALELPTLFSKSKSNAKAAAKQVRATRGQRRVARAIGESVLEPWARPKGLRREHQRYLRSFLMGLELWKYIVIQFRSKADSFFRKYKPISLQSANRQNRHEWSSYLKPSADSAQAQHDEREKHQHQEFPRTLNRNIHADGIRGNEKLD